MRKNWKYDSLILLQRMVTMLLFMVTLFLSACNVREEHKHIADKNVNSLDGLVQPVNQTVFSNVKTITPKQRSISPIIYATGLISYNPKLINNISSRFNGRIEKLYLRFNFQLVEKGQRIMDIYSPDILAEQQNLIYLLDNSNDQSEIIKSSEQKLSLLGLTSDQVSLIVRTKKPINPLPVYSPYSGHIHDIGLGNGIAPTLMSSTMNTNSTEVAKQPEIENLPVSQTSALSIKEGMYVQSGQPVFAVYNISQVWAILNIFQKDAAYLNLGDPVTIVSETSPDGPVKANINYIEPVTGLSNSAIKARVYLTSTQNHTFPIGTLVSAEILSREVNGIWVSRSAVVNQGKMQVVFVKVENHFDATEIHTGIETDSLVQVISGLNGNELIAENAQFMVDSESFIKTIENAK